MSNNDQDDVHVLAERLAEECGKAGLNATVLGATRVRVSAPGAHSRLTETVRCEADADENLVWLWSWNEPICPAAQIADAVKVIAYVVTPAVPTTI